MHSFPFNGRTGSAYPKAADRFRRQTPVPFVPGFLQHAAQRRVRNSSETASHQPAALCLPPIFLLFPINAFRLVTNLAYPAGSVKIPPGDFCLPHAGVLSVPVLPGTSPDTFNVFPPDTSKEALPGICGKNFACRFQTAYQLAAGNRTIVWKLCLSGCIRW